VSNVHIVRTIHSVISVTVLLFLLLNAIIPIPASSLAANSEALKWTRVNIPAEGPAGGWVLASSSDIQCLTVAPDNTLYAYVQGPTYTLYKSTDGGKRWSTIGDVQDEITDIAVSPVDAKVIYYATASSIYRSSDGGKNFIQLPELPRRAGANITSIAVTWLNNNIIAVGTADTNNGEFGGVYILDEGEIFLGWEDTNIGDYDVYALAFSPDYVTGRQIVAVVTNETDTFVFNRIGNTEWNLFISSARLNRNNSTTPVSVAAHRAEIDFPTNYQTGSSSSNSFFFVGIATGTCEGDVYKIDCADAPGYSAATDLNCGGGYSTTNIDITALTVYNDDQQITLLAGSAANSNIYISQDGGSSWTRSNKEPTGSSVTQILKSPDFTNTGIIYAATSGDGSAISISRDAGVTWNQISLIDTTISNIVDFVPSPDNSQNNNIFMITFGSGHSLWRSLDNGVNWERILCSNILGVDFLSLVNLPPQYGNNCLKLFVYGQSNGNPAVWVSEDNGQSYRCRFTRDPITGFTFTIDVWAIVDEHSFYAGSGYGEIYLTTDDGYTYSRGVSAGNSQLRSLVLSPNFENDGTILVGNYAGEVYWSNDTGSSFQPLPIDIASPLDGEVSVAFDPGFETNHTVYAASNIADVGIYRFVIGSSEAWESIDSSLPAGASIDQLVISADSVLYAANYNTDGGMERCLNPRFSLNPLFETVTRSLNDGATLSGLWQRNGQLWSIDVHNMKLMTYYDTLTSPIVPIAPENGSTGIGSLLNHSIKDITINWETMEDVTNYEWQCSYDTDFSSIPDGLSGTTSTSSVRLSVLESATTYYWRVRACSPVFSPWSDKWSFTTTMDTETVNLILESPPPGATGVSIIPVFQWTAVLGAEAYELLVATDADFNHPVIVKINEYALKTNAWNCDINLEYNTVYYWKIRATTASTSSAWSSVGIFTTEAFPSETLTTTTIQSELLTVQSSASIDPPTSPTPSTIATLLDIPAWMFYLFGGLFAIVILSLLIVLIIVIKIKRF
jgi:photosystem II stability/assembly factor-like uncharacterized protein